MSLLRPDAHRRARSKSPARSRSRSRSRSDVTHDGPSLEKKGDPRRSYGSLYMDAPAPQPSSPSTPQYELRQPSHHQAAPGLSSYITPGQLLSGAAAAAGPGLGHHFGRAESPNVGAAPHSINMEQPGFTMGGYADLPPHERPGYVPPPPPTSSGAQQPLNMQYTQPTQYNYTATPQGGGPPPPTSPTSQQPQKFQYAQPAQWSYTATPQDGSPPPQQTMRATPGGYPQAGLSQYTQPEGFKMTARPVTGQTGGAPPAIKHSVPTTSVPPMSGTTTASMPKPEHFMAFPPPPPPGPPPKQESYDPHLAYGVDNANIVEVKPGGGKWGAPPSPGLRPHRLSVQGPRPDLNAPPSPGLTPRMDRLSVSGNRPDVQNLMPGAFPGGGGIPPASPLLEAYHGTYQSISPMPSPMMFPRDDDLDDLPPLELRLSADDRRSKKKGHGRHRSTSNASHGHSPPRSARSSNVSLGGDRLSREVREREKERDKEKEKAIKRVKIYDAEEDARALVEALTGREPDADTLIDILPALSHDQMMELRTAYKRICKVQGRGINIAKHIKMKMPSGSNFGKICHVTALGRWESEAHWANYWYQGNNSKRELLIEALMGRSNMEIREIKAAFRDKRYGDSLTRCMETELKKDKFRVAVLTALEADRQEESEVYPLEYRNRDVDAMAAAVRRREGGETEILRIVCTRSDEHLRECLKVYERKWQGNFAREVLRKSNNLVGEIVTHILNGVINRPARDAMLLHHALMDLLDTDHVSQSSTAKHERQHRYELLISRLVRCHWDRLHLRRVKSDYREKYGREIEEDVVDATRGDFREFCLAVCEVGGR